MLKALKRIFEGTEVTPSHGYELRHLEVAVASLLHESTRVDLKELPEEYAAARTALADLFAISGSDSVALLEEGAQRARQLTSYYGPVSAIKRDFDLPRRILLIEHLWRIAYADENVDRLLRKRVDPGVLDREMTSPVALEPSAPEEPHHRDSLLQHLLHLHLLLLLLLFPTNHKQPAPPVPPKPSPP